jgi:hypothetical protein
MAVSRIIWLIDIFISIIMIASRRKWEWRSISCATPLKLNIAYIGVFLYRLHKLGSTFSTDEKLYAGCTRGERLQFLG